MDIPNFSGFTKKGRMRHDFDAGQMIADLIAATDINADPAQLAYIRENAVSLLQEACCALVASDRVLVNHLHRATGDLRPTNRPSHLRKLTF